MSQINLSNDKIYRYDVITDPDDPLVTESLEELLLIINNSNNIIVTEKNLDRGLVRYTLDVFSNEDKDPDINKRLNYLIGKVSYIPITVSLDLTLFKSYNNIAPVIAGVEEIVKVLTQKIIETDIINVEYTNFEQDVIIFNPITKDNISVYENPDHLSDYNFILNLDYIGGYQVLSDDPIVRYVLNKLYEDNEYNPEDIDVIYVKGVALIPVGTNDSEVKHYTDIKNRINTIVSTRRKEGYFSYSVDIQNLENLEIIRNLANLWSTDVVYDDDMTTVILKSDVDFGMNSELWFSKNIDIAKQGHFPTITLYGTWQFNVDGDYNEIYGKKWYKSILKYGAFLAYRNIGEEDSFIRPFTQTVKINNDYSITVSLPTYKHVNNFLKTFNDILSGYTDLTYQNKQTWYAEPCENLMDGIIKRYYIQNIDNKSMPMVLTEIYEDGTRDEVLIYRSPGLSMYDPRSPFYFENVDWQEQKDKLTKDMRDYYESCRLVGTKIKPLNLEDFLNIVEEDGKNYCFNKEIILNPPYINPVTQKRFHEDIILKAMLMEWGWRGLFSVGPLKGLYSESPKRILIKPTIGNPVINKLDIDELQWNLTGDVYEVEIIFEDNTVSPLFEIATDKIDDLKIFVNKLWYEGFFLNYWASAVEKYSKNINSSYSVIITDKILLHAGDTKEDGEKAMNYLQETNSIL